MKSHYHNSAFFHSQCFFFFRKKEMDLGVTYPQTLNQCSLGPRKIVTFVNGTSCNAELESIGDRKKVGKVGERNRKSCEKVSINKNETNFGGRKK